MILRAIGLVKEVYDWISFSEQAFSWLGLAQRAAAVAACGIPLSNSQQRFDFCSDMGHY